VIREEVSEEAERGSGINEPYKLEILEGIEEPIIYTTWAMNGGCAGPHAENTNELNQGNRVGKCRWAYWEMKPKLNFSAFMLLLGKAQNS